MVEIITDSSVLYTEEEAEAAGFEAIPMCVHIGDMEGRDLKIDMEEFYRRIAEGQVPRSSQPPIGDVAEAYERYPEARAAGIALVGEDEWNRIMCRNPELLIKNKGGIAVNPIPCTEEVKSSVIGRTFL